MKRAVVLIGVLALEAASCSSSGTTAFIGREDPLPICGTFSNLEWDATSERLVGAEIRIVPVECGYRASLQFGEGQGSDSNESRLIVVDVVFGLEGWPLGVPLPEFVPDAEDLHFSILPGSGYAGSFYGIVYRDRLDGLFTFADGRRMQVSLPRISGAWFEKQGHA